MLDSILNGLERLQKIPTAFLLALSIVLALLLFLPDNIAQPLAVKEFRDNYRKFLGPAFLLMVAFTATKCIMAAAHSVRQHSAKDARLRQLHRLTPEERGYLAAFILQQRNTIYVAPSDGVAGGLEAKAIIYRASNAFNVLEGPGYNLQPWAREYLEKNRHLLKGAVGEPLTNQERLFGRRPRFH